MKTETDYLQDVLQYHFNTEIYNWYAWKTHDDQGNKIPNNERMQYKYLEIIKEGAVMPTEAEVNTKIQEVKDAETATINNRASGKTKLKDLGLTDAEIKALTGA